MIPVEKNQEYEIRIEDVTSEGHGVGRIDGFAVFVPESITGDFLSVRIVKCKKTYAYGKILEVLEPSKVRATPACEKFGVCGGCQWMHVEYAAQLDMKRKVISDALERIGGVKVDEIPMYGMDEPFRYRNKMIFPVGMDRSGNTVCGFYRERSHDIVALPDCLLGSAYHAPLLETVKQYMQEFGVLAYNEETKKGAIRRIFTRTAHATGEVMVVICAAAKSLPAEEELVERVRSISPQITSIILNVHKKPSNVTLGPENRVLFGAPVIRDQLCGLWFEISVHSFFQINPTQTERLYRKAMEYAALKPSDIAMDVYCGIGTISLLAAQQCKKVIGVEIVPQAIEDAKKNAEENGIQNAEFYASDAQELVPKLLAGGVKPDVVFLDPPRKGSDEKTLNAIVESGTERIAYISCNPATLARDVRFLRDNGYALKQVSGFDMFPWTAHVETVVLLCRES